MTTPQITDAQIAEAAFFLWMEEGQPENRSNDHWFRARAALEGSVKPRRRAAAKPKTAAKAKPAKATKPKAAAKTAKATAPKKAETKTAKPRKAATKSKA